MTRILIAEDDVLNRLFLCEVLETNGYTIESVADGAQCISVAREFRPDLITMDIKLPNVSGVELISILQSDPVLKDVPVLALTAYAGKDEERRVRAAGATHFMTKPISVDALLAAVEAMLKSQVAASDQPEPGSGHLPEI